MRRKSWELLAWKQKTPSTIALRGDVLENIPVLQRETYMNKFSISWDLVKTSFAILYADKELIVLPIISSLLSILAMAALFGGYYTAYWPEIRAMHSTGPGRHMPHELVFYGLVFAFYVVNYFVVIFCNVALVGVANSRMIGGDWKLRDGLALAWSRNMLILQWAVLAATVGMILQAISERVGLLGKIVTGLVGLAWSLAIYFIVPVLAFENLGPLDALKRSARLFRETWGEAVVAGVSFSLVFSIPLFAGVGLWFLLLMASGPTVSFLIPGIILLALYMQVILAISSAVSSIFNVALYRYAITGQVQGGFSEDQLKSAWIPKE
jgi:hypothetical protein